MNESNFQERVDSNSGFLNLWRKPLLRNNLIGCCILASMTGFSSYMIGFYTKYFRGNMFINFAMLGIADTFSLVYITLISGFFDVKGVIRFTLVSVSIISMLFISLQNKYDWVTPVGILLLRLQMNGLENYRYHLT